MSNIVEELRSMSDEVADDAADMLERMTTHEGVDDFWRVWNEIGKPHKHGVYESTWAAFRRALGMKP